MRKSFLVSAPCALAFATASFACGSSSPTYGNPGASTPPTSTVDSGALVPDAAISNDDAGSGGQEVDAGSGQTGTPPTDDGGGAPNEGGATAEDSGSNTSPDASGSTTGTGTGKTDYAPYFEIGANTAAFSSLVDLQKKAGLNEVTLAFVLSGGGCSTDNTIPGAMSDIKAFIAAGGHVKASFGGADGKYVESGCTDAASLATAIGNFVDSTGITDLDFDIEQGPELTAAVNTMRGQALKTLQDSKHIQVAFTLEADSGKNGGLNTQGISVVTEAVAAGVTISHVNMMVMDFGNMPAGTALAPIAIQALTNGNAQLMKIIPGLTTEQAWGMIGATPDIGKNDDTEVFSLADAQSLATFAITNKLGLIAFWSIERDQVCGKGECSGYDVANFDYHNILKTVAQ